MEADQDPGIEATMTENKDCYIISGTISSEEPSYAYWNFVLGEGCDPYRKLTMTLPLDEEKGVSLPIYMKGKNEWIAYLNKKTVQKYALDPYALTYRVNVLDPENAVVARQGGQLCLH
ncbi:MAG: hypothetical protein K5682_10195 [Lachnospiraceae bacterium]|nr:hypothetical protein [Lachnospiraceae bacterium]